jgi:hypothetical protein
MSESAVATYFLTPKGRRDAVSDDEVRRLLQILSVKGHTYQELTDYLAQIAQDKRFPKASRRLYLRMDSVLGRAIDAGYVTFSYPSKL